MITIDLGTVEYYDPETNQFTYKEGGKVRFEYTLKVVYKWEGKWRKPFLKGDASHEEMIDFYITMALDPIDEDFITDKVMEILSTYIKDSHTATTFNSDQNGDKGFNKPKVYTSEELYALMFMSGINIDFENRNLNRLITVLRVIGAYNEPPKKMSKADIYRQNARLNAERRKQMNSKG